MCNLTRGSGGWKGGTVGAQSCTHVPNTHVCRAVCVTLQCHTCDSMAQPQRHRTAPQRDGFRVWGGHLPEVTGTDMGGLQRGPSVGFVPLMVTVREGGGGLCCPLFWPWGRSRSMSRRFPPGPPGVTPQCGDSAAAPPPAPAIPAATAHLGVRSPQPQGSGHPTTATRRPAERIGSTGRYRGGRRGGGGGHKVGHAAATKPRSQHGHITGGVTGSVSPTAGTQ